jgi:EAL domain-containing protein (putative c-di-GMP-specific phosphodiesterase class I)/GGDEF domain-containing protein
MSAPMSAQALVDSLPDLVLLVQRDGLVVAHAGGSCVTPLKPVGSGAALRCEQLWPEPVALLIRQLVRKAIAERTTTEMGFEDRGNRYEARCSAQGPDRAICVIRPVLHDAGDAGLDSTAEHVAPQLDRRGFLRRFRNSMQMAALAEKPAAVAVLHLEGVADVARLIDSRLSEQLLHAAILRLPREPEGASGAHPGWYLGQLSEGMLAVVLETADRDLIEACVTQLCTSLRTPIHVGGAAFHLTPYAGVAIMGHDAATPALLLEHARAAASEARRAGLTRICFFADTLDLRSLARLDIASELRGAIANRAIRLRYVGRHEFETGQLVCYVGYLRWTHPLRGEVRPAEFLRVAETTGLAATLSRALLDNLREDFESLQLREKPGVRISFGALRHHILQADFVADLSAFLAADGVPAERLELRISERSFISADPAAINALSELGVRLVVDEVGRGLASLDALARAPIWGLQLDRAWVSTLCTDPVALKVCRAGIGVARALDLIPIATGVDSPQQREALLELRCPLGSGDLYQAEDLTGTLCDPRLTPASSR